jgi:CBS domain-containing protein
MSDDHRTPTRATLAAAPTLEAALPIGDAAAVLRQLETPGARVERGDGAWGWVTRTDVLAAARLGAGRSSLRRLVGSWVQRKAPRAPIRLEDPVRRSVLEPTLRLMETEPPPLPDEAIQVA